MIEILLSRLTRLALPAAIAFLFVAQSAFSQNDPPRRLDTTTLIVMGEGLAAGFSNFSLSEEAQRGSFPALMARQMGTVFPQPVFLAPGVGDAPGFEALPVGLPKTLQTTVRAQSPPTLFVFNLSIPGLSTAEALTRRPVQPLLQESDPQQTLINLVLGYPSLILEERLPSWTQLEYALKMRPTLTLIELGFTEVLESSVEADLRKLPDPAEFGRNLDRIVANLRSVYSEVILLTIPDPISTAFFSTQPAAESFLGLPPGTLQKLYGLSHGSLLTVPGLVEVGQQLVSRKIAPLPSRSYLPRSVAEQITTVVDAMNQEIRTVAARHRAVLFDLHGLYETVRESGLVVADCTLTGGYLGGFYLLNGYYPGLTGHARIANDLLELLNREYGTRFQSVDLSSVLEKDSAAHYSTGDRGGYTEADLKQFAGLETVTRLRGARPPRTNMSPDTRVTSPSKGKDEAP